MVRRKDFLMKREKTVAATLDEAEEMIAERQSFRLRGQTDPPTLWAVTEAPSFLGHLPPEFSEGIENAEYVVMSFRTPIAWIIEEEMFVPDIGYSPTTGQHQRLVQKAFGKPVRFPARGRKVVPAGGGPRSGGWDTSRYGGSY
jgi:hypothetical protein